ncbi:hypothetical protein NA57DRAFT_77654 [Rhizodiscina lignyota]|uniref:SWIRM domain-containing protein n=1 Tax=Rhizodiscina lignyota TaxID=1504668 RepID=A0A9P4IF68_9PEZI|nr:hypothetical protein NA57DRAFT_77654 [Rhizodiscina lignyota]
MDSFSSPINPANALTPLSSFASDAFPQGRQLPTPQSTATKLHRDPTDPLPPSPPVSPSEQKENIEDVDEAVQDPQLFSQDGTIGSDFPLFPQEQSNTFDEVIQQHMRTSPAPLRPTRDEYLLAVSCVAKAYNKDPKAWLARERKHLDRYGPKNRVAKRTITSSQPLRKLAPAPFTTIRKQKPIALPRLPRAPRPVRIPRAPRDTPKSIISDSFDLYESPSPKPVKAPTSRDDVDYHAIPDYSPPVSSLPPNNNKSLSVDWRVGTIDLSADPDRHLLHEAELYCAARLRLSCATYLCSKRRIFQARLSALRIGKEFRKTDAQQACKIDVNKASKLWTAFDKVGWFNPKYFEQYL